MSGTTWRVDVDGAPHTITVERDAQTRRSMIRIDGRMAAKPMTDDEEERELSIGNMRYVIRRLDDDQFELDVPPEIFLNQTASKMRSGRKGSERATGGGWGIGKIIGGVVVLLIVAGLVRVGHEGLAYTRMPWKPYADADGTFKAIFPGDPEQEKETLNINGDLWEIVTLKSRHRNHLYTVEYVDARMVITEKNSLTVVDQFLQAWMGQVGARLEQREEITLARNPAISFTARIPKGAGQGEDRLDTDARQRGILAVRNNRILVAWTLSAEADPISWDLRKFLEAFEISPPEDRPTSLAEVFPTPPAEVAPAPQRVVQQDVAAATLPGVEMAQPVARVYAHNKTKTYYPADCKARPADAYPIARSLAVSQGFTLAKECQKR